MLLETMFTFHIMASTLTKISCSRYIFIMLLNSLVVLKINIKKIGDYRGVPKTMHNFHVMVLNSLVQRIKYEKYFTNIV